LYERNFLDWDHNLTIVLMHERHVCPRGSSQECS